MIDGRPNRPLYFPKEDIFGLTKRNRCFLSKLAKILMVLMVILPAHGGVLVVNFPLNELKIRHGTDCIRTAFLRLTMIFS